MNSKHHYFVERMIGSRLGLPSSLKPFQETTDLNMDSNDIDDDYGIKIYKEALLYTHSPVILSSLHLLYEVKKHNIFHGLIRLSNCVIINMKLALGTETQSDISERFRTVCSIVDPHRCVSIYVTYVLPLPL